MPERGILDFYSVAQGKEFARDFLFRVISLGPFSSDDLLFVKTATLPGKEISNQVVPFFGLDFNVPGSVKYTGSAAWALTIRCDEGLNIRNKLENWMNEIFDIQTSTGKYGVPTEIATLDLLGKDLERVRRYEFVGIYPVSIGEISYDVGGTGTPLEFQSTFSYQYWRPISG